MKTNKKPMEIRPQMGPQENFCAHPADIVIYGGQAGGGKSFGLILESCRNVDHPNYRGIIFRRTHPEIVAGGGLWDTANDIYPILGGVGKEESRFTFPSGARVEFRHLQHESDKNKHYGAQYSFIAFDELITFERSQFFFLLGRMRPPNGYDRPCYLRATTNPDADSWVRELIEWWIDEDGYPVPERSGAVRYFTVEDNKVIWVSKAWRGDGGELPFSISYIPASLEDNPALLERDPNYRRNLYAQDKVTRERLLYGNWKISYSGGMFDPKWFQIISRSEIPANLKLCRYWDFAATEAAAGSDPDWTAGALCGTANGNLYIIDIERFREAPGTTITRVKAAAGRDGRSVMVSWEQERGSAGAFNSEHLRGGLAGYEYRADPVSGDKVERAKPLAAAAEFGRVFIIEGDWNKDFLAEAGSFPTRKRDQIDAVDGAYKMLCVLKKVWPEWSAELVVQYSINWHDKKYIQKCVHLAAMVYTPDGTAAYVAAIYDPSYNQLFAYDCAEFAGGPADMATAILRRSRIGAAPLTKLLGSDMFAPPPEVGVATLINREFMRLNAPERITAPRKFDEYGAVAFLGQMFADGRVMIHVAAAALAIEAAGWCIDAATEKPERGKRYAVALCLIGSELRERLTAIAVKKRADYAPVGVAKKTEGSWMST